MTVNVNVRHRAHHTVVVLTRKLPDSLNLGRGVVTINEQG
jgi:hypothetical protein